ncbi:MAG: twin-arginine translocation signal domain-containing protein, partial [Stellaceae bacterium]
MTQKTVRRQWLSRRSLLAGTTGAIGTAALAPSLARAQQNANLGTPATVTSNPPRDFARGHPSI